MIGEISQVLPPWKTQEIVVRVKPSSQQHSSNKKWSQQDQPTNPSICQKLILWLATPKIQVATQVWSSLCWTSSFKKAEFLSKVNTLSILTRFLRMFVLNKISHAFPTSLECRIMTSRILKKSKKSFSRNQPSPQCVESTWLFTFLMRVILFQGPYAAVLIIEWKIIMCCWLDTLKLSGLWRTLGDQTGESMDTGTFLRTMQKIAVLVMKFTPLDWILLYAQ